MKKKWSRSGNLCVGVALYPGTLGGGEKSPSKRLHTGDVMNIDSCITMSCDSRNNDNNYDSDDSMNYTNLLSPGQGVTTMVLVARPIFVKACLTAIKYSIASRTYYIFLTF